MNRCLAVASSAVSGRPAHVFAISVTVVVLTLVACSGPQQQPELPDMSAGLFLSVGGDANGLYAVDTGSGLAQRVGAGITGTTSVGPGLARGATPQELFGSNDTQLRSILTDGSGWTAIGDHSALSEGLAYDPETQVLFGSSNGFLHVRSPATGATLETWLTPPNEPDIEGLAFDLHSRTLFGLARGHPDQPEFRQELYAMDVEAAKREWTAVGSTEGLWENPGLAFDQDGGVLYAVGRQGDLGGLYRIDPDSAATVRVGSTGLSNAAGGLAWVDIDD